MQERIIEWNPKEPVSVGNSLVPAEIVGLEIIDFVVANNSVLLDQPFLAGDDWLKDFSVRVRNISEKPILGVRLDFSLPETRSGNVVQGFNLEYGKGEAAQSITNHHHK